MVVIRPKLGICWSYVEIYMYMTNILIVVITRVGSYENIFCIFATDRRCPPTSYVGLIRARRTNPEPIVRAARPCGIFACLALSRPYLADSVLRGTTLGSHFPLFRLSLNSCSVWLFVLHGTELAITDPSLLP